MQNSTKLIGFVVLLVVLIGAIFFGYRYYNKMTRKPNDSGYSQTIPQNMTSSPSQSAMSAGGTSNQQLEQDNQTVDQDLNALNSDLNSIDQGLNDQQVSQDQIQ